MGETRNRDEVLWSEMTATEKAAEKADFIASFVLETGCSKRTAAIQWEQYINQEGFTARDESIMVRREARGVATSASSRFQHHCSDRGLCCCGDDDYPDESPAPTGVCHGCGDRPDPCCPTWCAGDYCGNVPPKADAAPKRATASYGMCNDDDLGF